MDRTITLEDIARKLDRVDAKLTTLLNKPKKETWVSVRFIQDLTGWDGLTLFEVRKQNIITHRKNKNGGYEYLLESIPDQFIKKTT